MQLMIKAGEKVARIIFGVRNYYSMTVSHIPYCFTGDDEIMML